MADVVLECKSRKPDGSSSSDSEPDDQEVQEKIKKLDEEKQRKILEEETRRLKRRIERKRKREGSSSSSSQNQQPESTQSQFEKIMLHLKSMKANCDTCKSLGTPKSQMDYLKAIYMRITAIEKLLKDQ